VREPRCRALAPFRILAFLFALVLLVTLVEQDAHVSLNKMTRGLTQEEQED
jgi:hypothetical protein